MANWLNKRTAVTNGQGGYGYDFEPREVRKTLIRSKLEKSELEKLSYDELQKALTALAADA